MYLILFFFFFFNDTAPPEIYTLSLHDALPIWMMYWQAVMEAPMRMEPESGSDAWRAAAMASSRTMKTRRSEEHTSELQSLRHLVCRLLLEKKKKKKKNTEYN